MMQDYLPNLRDFPTYSFSPVILVRLTLSISTTFALSTEATYNSGNEWDSYFFPTHLKTHTFFDTLLPMHTTALQLLTVHVRMARIKLKPTEKKDLPIIKDYNTHKKSSSQNLL